MNRITFKSFIVFLICILTLPAFAQDEPESAKPLTNAVIMRRNVFLDIEGEYFDDVTITFKSISPDYFFTHTYRVKVKVTDSNKKVIYNKTLKNAFLYVFSDGQIQVGRVNFDQIIIYNYDGDYYGTIREKEGIY